MKLITWNLQWGVGVDGRCDLGRQIEAARAIADFDVLCLQEVADNFPELSNQGGVDQLTAIADLLPGYTAIAGIGLDLPAENGGRKRFGNMILSRLPVGPVTRHALPYAADTTPSMPRLLLEATIMAPSGAIRVMTSHLEWFSRTLRGAQVAGIREAHRLASLRAAAPRDWKPGTTFVAPVETKSAILVGDFNMTPDDPLLADLAAPFAEPATPRLIDAWAALHPGSPHPHSFCIYEHRYGEAHCCDYAFVSEELASRLTHIAYIGDTQASDHQPVLLELAA